MSIVVVGGGAIGLLVAGRLAQAGQRVAVLARPNVAAALQAQPFVMIEGQSSEGGRKRRAARLDGEEQAPEPLTAAATPAELPASFRRPDLAILCVKSYDTAATLDGLATLAPWQLLTLQNGLGNEEQLIARFGAESVLSGAITSSVEVVAPGRVRVAKSGGIGLATPGDASRLIVWAAVLGRAGFALQIYPDYRALKWSKALLNMLGNATPAILDMPVEAVYADWRLVDLERQAFREALAVMAQCGIAVVNLPGYPAALLAFAMRWLPQGLLYPLLQRLIAGGRGGKRPSLHRDLLQGRTVSEGTYLYGAIAQAAQEHGLTAPANQTLCDLLQGIARGEPGWERFRQQPERLLAAVRQPPV